MRSDIIVIGAGSEDRVESEILSREMAKRVVDNMWNQDLVVVTSSDSDQANNNMENNIQTVSSSNFEAETDKNKPSRGKNKKWKDLKSFESFQGYESSEFYKEKVVTKDIVTHRNRNGVVNYVCRYQKKRGYSCQVEFRLISEVGKFTLQEPVEQSEHNHDLVGDRKYNDYTKMNDNLIDMVKCDVKSNKMVKQLKEKDLVPPSMKREQFHAKVNRVKKKLKLDQVIFI